MARGIKTGGRIKGTPNKTTSEIKQIIADFIGYNIQNMQNHYDYIDAKDKLLFIDKLLKYTIPAKASNEIDINDLSDVELNRLCDTIIKKMNDDAECR